MVIFIWNELEKQDFLQQQDLRAKKAKEQDFNIALRRFDLHHGKKSPRKHPDENVENQVGKFSLLLRTLVLDVNI
jgi:hypothetical protein